jgi:hypothetical protein
MAGQTQGPSTAVQVGLMAGGAILNALLRGGQEGLFQPPEFQKRRQPLLAPSVPVQAPAASGSLALDPIVQAYLGRLYG